MKTIVITVRAIIIYKGQLFMCRHNEPNRTYYNLPGGKLELDESLTDALIRELIEETGVKPQLGHLMFINQFMNPGHHRVEFFFWVQNGADYITLNTATASHADEVADFTYGDPTSPQFDIRPSWLAMQWADILKDPAKITGRLMDPA